MACCGRARPRADSSSETFPQFGPDGRVLGTGSSDGVTRLWDLDVSHEADRICALVDRMEIFADREPSARSAVNIHEVLDHVKAVAVAGFLAIAFLARESHPGHASSSSPATRSTIQSDDDGGLSLTPGSIAPSSGSGGGAQTTVS